jgi:hypothetical protein
MTYEESNALTQDMTFRGRCKIACLKFAGAILLEPPGTAARNTRSRWAVSCQQSPDMTAQQVQSPVVMDPAIQTSGAEIDDAGLQAAVEGVVNQSF